MNKFRTHRKRWNGMTLKWNWRKSFYGLIQFGIILFLLSFSYGNVDKINNVFFAVPIGIIFSILIKQLYGIMKWYRIWINATRTYKNIIVHICLYSIILYMAVSAGMSYLWK